MNASGLAEVEAEAPVDELAVEEAASYERTEWTQALRHPTLRFWISSQGRKSSSGYTPTILLQKNCMSNAVPVRRGFGLLRPQQGSST